ncbi:protease inhibitor I42 family protein [uncultured Flavobacterium sp.]|uniref:protease inhibitor I42 family protein n=1 Tax=uncultured Flavobacterium sp. TaxID=165435 RepID=UPI0025DF644B|nr:protease inhibitor I42 family protein [uncultured Flavobacterium sp.]
MKPIRIIVFIVTLLITLGVLFYTDSRDYYPPGENASIKVKVGDTFIIKLDENPSAGGKNCWLTGMRYVKLLSAEFDPRSSADGAGGITAYTFKAALKGIDTLKVANCRLAGEKSCKDYDGNNTRADNIFIINVSQ